ncbi:succinylglutamate desuccinylase/aspartoacylase family protein [uncultured Thiothrix sp.]|uniref:succinylglutamate desuccinylase/aspartoacylase family protein n=1 Tax=uncultured Thiothrix sp. TaxID=223185 RepID=UPI002619FE13|nr:succinylglutamate desuccinylase/aspartoacylase family protein [uncultured Thiothrix sp.]HMT94610.1 M14 family metallopeptidase [Thiolinea sp.]
MKKITHKIYGDSPGKTTELVCFKLGSEQAQRKVYLQAALHADEQPGILVLHHLLKLLKQAEEQGLLNAQFMVFPMVNPLGMGDIGFRQHQGRYDRASGVNFNRNWPDLCKAVEVQVAEQLTEDAQQNIQIVRSALKAWIAQQQPVNALQQQRHIVLQSAFDADYVLDLHCDNEALPHIFTVPQSATVMQDLSDWMGAAATLLAENSGGYSFDEVWSKLWIDLAKVHPDKPLPLACHSATLEYRGQFDTFDELNHEDAERLYGFLQSQGLIGGEMIRLRPEPTPAATDLAATEMTRVQQAGLLAYKVKLGDVVQQGDVLADLIALDGEGAFVERIPVLAGTDGVIISRNIHKYVWPGCSVAKIVGKQPLASRGDYLLED